MSEMDETQGDLLASALFAAVYLVEFGGNVHGGQRDKARRDTALRNERGALGLQTKENRT